MGVIENGTVSGTFPSNEVFFVHYPGYPSSTSRVIKTLGGNEGLITARGSKLNKLELRFRPEDPYAHPTLGELRSCNSFLLKISKKKLIDDAQPHNHQMNQPENQPFVATNDAAACLSENHVNLCVDIVSRASESYHFDGMADYQHIVPIYADVAHRKKRKWMELESLSEKGDLLDLADEDVMMLLPPLFAPKDVPENLVLRPPATSGWKRKEEVIAQNYHEMDIEPGFAIDFSVKEIPKKLNWEEFIVRGSEEWKWQEAVSELFDERPIWPRESLTKRLLDRGLKCTHHMLNRFLLRAAYYFSGGPFLRFWIKRGYDARKDPDSRVYQRIEFRVPPELRSYCDANAANESKPRWEDICAFKVFPFKCQTFLQFFELDDDYIQQEIRKPPKQTACTYRTGWFSESMVDTLRLRVAVRFISVYPNPDVEDVLKSTIEEFERSKNMCIHKDALKPCQEKHQQVNKGNTGHEDNEKSKVINDDKEDDENQADEDDEDPDEYEGLDLAAEDDEVSLQSHGYLDMENNSRTYLQELLDNFPMNEEAGLRGLHDGDGSDGEYQIYEQDSDDNYSDDDGDEEEDDE